MYKKSILLVLVLTLALSFSGCFITDAIGRFFGSRATTIVVTPNEVNIALDAEVTAVELEASIQDQRGKAMEVEEEDIEWSIVSAIPTNGENVVAALSGTTGAEVTVTGLQVGTAEITVTYGKLSAKVPVTVVAEGETGDDEPGDDENVIFYQDFSLLDEGTNIFSADFANLPGTDDPMYKKTGGNVSVVSNGLEVANSGRFTIGTARATNATKEEDDANHPDRSPGGCLDLSEPFKVTIVLVDSAPGEGNKGNFQLLVDNNHTDAAESIHGGKSRIYSLSLKTGEDIEDIIAIEDGIIESEVIDFATDSSFIQIRADGKSMVVIKSIKIEYVEEDA